MVTVTLTEPMRPARPDCTFKHNQPAKTLPSQIDRFPRHRAGSMPSVLRALKLHMASDFRDELFAIDLRHTFPDEPRSQLHRLRHHENVGSHRSYATAERQRDEWRRSCSASCWTTSIYGDPSRAQTCGLRFRLPKRMVLR